MELKQIYGWSNTAEKEASKVCAVNELQVEDDRQPVRMRCILYVTFKHSSALVWQSIV